MMTLSSNYIVRNNKLPSSRDLEDLGFLTLLIILKNGSLMPEDMKVSPNQ